MDRYSSTKKASILGITMNIFLLIIKGTVGFISHSQSMISDAVNSAGDVFSSLMTYIGNRIASKPRDNDHNLGHGKAEYVFSLLISLSLIYVALVLCFNCIKSIFVRPEYTYSIYLVIVSSITIIVKFCLYLYTNSIYKKHNNILIKANANDHRNDCFVTTFTLISIICAKNSIYLVDSIVGTGIALWILYQGIRIFIESYNVLMDKSIDKCTRDKVIEIINSHPEVKGYQHFNSTPVGYKYQISFSIFVDGNLTTFESHRIADHLEEEIDEKVDEIYLTVIHVNPTRRK